MTKYKVWRVENDENRKLTKYVATICEGEMTYLGHMNYF
jgi:hypothetical protein